MKPFTREISFETELSEQGHLLIMGTLRDHRRGVLLHHIEVQAEVGLIDGRIHSLEGSMPFVPIEDCREALKTLSGLIGEHIVPGFSDTARRVVGSSQGCTHLSVLVTNLGHTSVQARAAVAMAGSKEVNQVIKDQAVSLGLPGSCYAWREDGPIMRRWKIDETKKG